MQEYKIWFLILGVLYSILFEILTEVSKANYGFLSVNWESRSLTMGVRFYFGEFRLSHSTAGEDA